MAITLFAMLPIQTTIVQAIDAVEFSANVAFTTDYVWRGVTQTNEK